MKFSIVIPTFNRNKSLMKVLSSIRMLDFPKEEYEVIIVDDGSSDNTKDSVNEFKLHNDLNIRYFFQKNQGPGKARNFGIDNAQGEIILFCGDDTIFSPQLLNRHLLAHGNNHQAAVLGLVLWDEGTEVNDFMRYIAPSGPQFHYNTIKDKNDAGWNHFYTANISIPKKAIDDIRFDSRFIYAAFEDIDFGLALAKKDVKVIYDPEAIVYHNHYYQPESFYKRMELVGRSYVFFKEKYRNCLKDIFNIKFRYAPFDFFPGQRRLFSLILSLLIKIKFINFFNLRLYWYLNICHRYCQGIEYQLNLKK